MIISTLPLIPSVASYRVGTTLTNAQYLLDVRWNSREEFWYMDILAENGDAILQGIKLLLGPALGSSCVDPRFPPGLFFASDLTNRGLEATFDDMGTRVVVYYISAT